MNPHLCSLDEDARAVVDAELVVARWIASGKLGTEIADHLHMRMRDVRSRRLVIADAVLASLATIVPRPERPISDAPRSLMTHLVRRQLTLSTYHSSP